MKNKDQAEDFSRIIRNLILGRSAYSKEETELKPTDIKPHIALAIGCADYAGHQVIAWVNEGSMPEPDFYILQDALVRSLYN